MTNSMSNIEFSKNLINQSFKILETDVISQYQVSFVVEQTDVVQMLVTLKNNGWKQMSYLTAVDWPDENKFEIVYILMNWERAVHVQVRSKIDRENPVMPSIINVYPGAKYYERECHEFFGIKFPGNPDYEKQLILEMWDDIPPLRKDFDPNAYSNKKFTRREYNADYKVLSEENKNKEKREDRKARAQSLKGGGNV
ncbi:MAG: NADH-quinone oxidoreductase subunit C [Acholeplasmataceae bacterium]|nr:NADH-quinone oxidoreductase subunit C [Acholeplasmataceae bacterium]